MFLQRSSDIAVGLYDFGVSGGAIGAYDLQIPIPAFSMIQEFAVVMVTAFASGGAATVSFDRIRTDVSPQVVVVANMIAATAIATYGAADVVTYGRFPGGAGANIVLNIPFAWSVGMSIAAAALTAGKVKVMVRYTTFEF